MTRLLRKAPRWSQYVNQPTFTRPSSSAAGRRRLDLSPPFPTVSTCPEPTCACAETPQDLDIDYEQKLNGTMAGYSQQVLIATGQPDWRSRIEEDGVDEGWGMLGRGLKGLIGRGGKYSDPYNNILITNSSFPTNLSQSTKQDKKPSSAAAFIFPSFKYVPDIPLTEDGLERFVRAFLLPRNVHSAHDVLPEEQREKMKKVPELEGTFENLKAIQHSPTVLICGHGHRDKRCGIMGPLLRSEFQRVLRSEGFSTTEENPNDGGIVDEPGHANLALISHIGGHKYAGNVIIYLPPSIAENRQVSGESLAGKGIWYGRVEPRHVEGIVKETILKGRVVTDHFRGGVGLDGQMLRM
ncbi:hypothetical protein FQN54_008556 [Arachnomyces sp. PD_36]|nr:hypothetical protein FQN54_008556 [Arachnomyces sp. PD_36]